MTDTSLPDVSSLISLSGRVLAIANQKGGVGKTTTTINIATALAAIKKKVLLIDLDPQGNAGTGLGIYERGTTEDGAPRTIYSALMGDCFIDDATHATSIPELWLVPSTMDLSGAEIELINEERREFRLQSIISAVRHRYDYILIDCPPALGLLTVNALVAAEAVLVPLQCEFFALEGISHLIKTVELVKQRFNPGLSLQGIVLTMYDQRSNLSHMVGEDVRAHFGELVYNTVIPRNVRISEAPSHGLPVLIYDMKCAGSRAYLSLTGEIIHREQCLQDAQHESQQGPQHHG